MDTERIDEHRLLELFQRGDRDALTSLYRAHYPAVYRFALYMTGDRDAAAEITQETFLWLIHHPAAFQPERGTLGSFLCGVARNLLQSDRRKRRHFVPLSEATPGGSAPDTGIDLRKAIVALPEVYREAVILCSIEGKSYEEAAVLLNCAVGTVRSRVHRAKLHLARQMAPIGLHAHE
jgi:RNA polymerase sigma-70 factor (ECF subfamily)